MGIISKSISVRVAIIVSACILLVICAGTFFLITQQANRLEDDLLQRGKMNSILGAKMFGKIMDEAIDNGAITVADAFDVDYQPIGNFDPPKFHTKYDFYTDKAVLSIIDEFLIDESVVFAVPVDKNGYLPTHNTRYQKPITGDKEKDKVGNRTKRVFNDPVGLKAAKNQDPGLLQVYHRDTGKVMWDVSSPIFVKGKHWGGFRIGVSLDVIDKEKKKLMVNLTIVMGIILIVAILITFFSVKKALLPLGKITKTATLLASGKNINTEIPVTREDEIGKLEAVLERLRMSMLIFLKKRKG